MKKALVLLLILIIAVSLFMFTGCKNQDEKGKLYVYTESGFPPFEYPSGNDIVGVDIEIAKTIADRLGMELVVKDVNFEAILAALTDDNAIGLAGLTITPDREEEVDFSIPYFEAVQYVVYKEGTLTLDENSMVSGAQLKNKVIGTQAELRAISSPMKKAPRAALKALRLKATTTRL